MLAHSLKQCAPNHQIQIEISSFLRLSVTSTWLMYFCYDPTTVWVKKSISVLFHRWTEAELVLSLHGLSLWHIYTACHPSCYCTSTAIHHTQSLGSCATSFCQSPSKKFKRSIIRSLWCTSDLGKISLSVWYVEAPDPSDHKLACNNSQFINEWRNQNNFIQSLESRWK